MKKEGVIKYVEYNALLGENRKVKAIFNKVY
jgi:hypothetical protein